MTDPLSDYKKMDLKTFKKKFSKSNIWTDGTISIIHLSSRRLDNKFKVIAISETIK